MKLLVKKNSKHKTYDYEKNENGFLVPIYNVNDLNNPKGYSPKQVYLTTIKIGKIKGPHLHYKRDGYFTCIKGDVRVILKIDNKYEEFFSGENHDYSSVFIPKGTPAAIQNISNEDAFLLNMPSPAWTKDMNDEYSADFSDFDYKI